MRKEFRSVLLFFVFMLLFILVLTFYQPVLTGNASLSIRQTQGNLQGNLYVAPEEIGGVIPLDSEISFEYNGLTSNIKLRELLTDEVLALSQEDVDFAPLIRVDYEVVQSKPGGFRSRVVRATTTATSTSSGGGSISSGGGSIGSEGGSDDGDNQDSTGFAINEGEGETVIYLKKDAFANIVISSSDNLVIESVSINGEEISQSSIDLETSKSGGQQYITITTDYVQKVNGFTPEAGQLIIPLDSFFNSVPVSGGQANFKVNLIYNGEQLVSSTKSVFVSQAAISPATITVFRPDSGLTSGGAGNLPGFPSGIIVTNIVTAALATGPEVGGSNSYTVVTPQEFCRLINDCSYTNLDGVVSQDYSYTKKEMCYYGNSIYMKETQCTLDESESSSFNSYSKDDRVFVEKKNTENKTLFTVIRDRDLETIDILFNN